MFYVYILNKYTWIPMLKMKYLDKLLKLVQNCMWAAIINVKETFLSVKII